jgi:crotonobetainyl-CoA:carnitine CoA-transferase CaiB-like acyl-CoA transferase
VNSAVSEVTRTTAPAPGGATHIVGSPVNLESFRTGVRRDVPDLGEHSSEVLAEAGLTTEQIATLRAKGTCGGT